MEGERESLSSAHLAFRLTHRNSAIAAQEGSGWPAGRAPARPVGNAEVSPSHTAQCKYVLWAYDRLFPTIFHAFM
jgi:hypothetical protein